MNLTCHRCHRPDDEMALVVVAQQFEHPGDCPPPDSEDFADALSIADEWSFEVNE